MKKYLFFSAICASLLLSGCAQNVSYVQGGQVVKNSKALSLSLDHTDFEKAASDAVESLLSSGSLNRPGGGRYVVSIDRVINDTTQRIDTDLITKKLRIAMLKSGKAIISTAIQAGGPESTLTKGVRELRDDEEIKQNTIAKKRDNLRS